jgi:hypothetical protein
MVQVASLRSKSLGLFTREGAECRLTIPEIKKIMFQAQELDAQLVSWASVVPDSFLFSIQLGQVSLGPPGSDLHFTGPIHSYATHGHATIWNRHRACRLIVNSIRKRTMKLLMPHGARCYHVFEQIDLCQANIVAMTDDICSSIPFFSKRPTDGNLPADFGTISTEQIVTRIEGESFPQMVSLLAWVLTVAVSTEDVPESQREWLKQRLKYASLAMHDSVLESVIDRGEFRF